MPTQYGEYADLTVRKIFCDEISTTGNISIEGDIAIGGETNDYSTDIELNLTPATMNSDAWSMVDGWLKKNFINTPPAPTNGSNLADTAKITLSWTNPVQVEAGFSDILVPRIDDLKVEFRAAAGSGDTDWSSATVVSMNPISNGSTAVNCTSAEFYIEGSGSNLNGNTFEHYTIAAQTAYDFRVYAVNKNDTFVKQYLYFYNIQTVGVGVPVAPVLNMVTANSTSQLTSSWTKPTDHDNTTEGDQTNPLIQNYQVTYQPVSSVRYNDVDNTTALTASTANGGLNNASTSLALTSLLPGTVYDVKVKARNTQNATYGADSNAINNIATNNPSSGSVMTGSDTNGFSTPSVLSNSGAQLDGTSLGEPILNNPTTIETNTSGALRVNNTAGATADAVSVFTAFGGDNSDFTTAAGSSTSITVNGFGGAAASTTESATKITLNLSQEGDLYTGTSAGFWKKVQVSASTAAAQAQYPASVTKYSMKINQNISGGSSIDSAQNDFFVDNISAPSISNLGITDASTPQYVSGVPSYDENSTFSTQFNMTNVANFFIRNDNKHAIARMYDGSSAVGSENTISRDGSAIYYAGTGDHTTSSTLHNTNGTQLATGSGEIQFQTTLNLTSIGDRFDEALQVKATPYNIHSTGTEQSAAYVSATDGSTAAIRVDTQSLNTISLTDSASSTTGGLQVKSGSGQYPSIGSGAGEAGDTYSHSDTIVGTEELQLVNGTFQTAASVGSDGYKTYSNFFFTSGSTIPDYSTLSSETGYRYVTFKFTGVISSGTYGRIRMTLTGSDGLTMDLGSSTSNHRLFMKVEGTSGYNTGWLDCTKGVGPTPVYTNNGEPVLETGSSTLTQRDCYITTGTPSSAVFYVRFGQAMDVSSKLKYVSLQAVTSF